MTEDDSARTSGTLQVRLPFEAESAGAARTAFEGWIAAQRSRGQFVDDCRLVVSELVGNAIRHARPLDGGLVELRCSRGDDGLDIAVTDGGAGKPPRKVEAGPTDLTGRGLAIVETLAERWWVERSDSGTTVHAVLEPA